MDPKLLGIIGVACYLSAVTIGGLMVHWIDRRGSPSRCSR